MGTYSDEIRAAFVNEFNQYLYESDYRTLPWAFFDVVLDESFEQLKVNISGPGVTPDLQVIPTISIRSPKMKKLAINFESLDTKLSAGLTTPLVLQLKFLNYLSSLTLVNLDWTHKGSLVYIGDACPHLKHLALIELTLTGDDLINLLLGENGDKLRNLQLAEDDIYKYQVPGSWLTPMSQCLENLELETFEEKKKLERTRELSAIAPSIIAFILRHMPKLLSISYSGTSVCLAVKMLHQVHEEYWRGRMEDECAASEDLCDNKMIQEHSTRPEDEPLLSKSRFEGKRRFYYDNRIFLR